MAEPVVKTKMTEAERAEVVIEKVKTAVKRKFPFLTPIVSRIQFERVDNKLDGFETDRIKIYYNAEDVLRYYSKRTLASLEKKYVHIIMHGLLGHFEARDDYLNKKLVDDAMDFKVNEIIEAMYGAGPPALPNNYFGPNPVYADMKEFKGLGLTEIYYKCEASESRQFKLNRIAEPMRVDNHELWKVKFKTSRKTQSGNGGTGGGIPEDKKYGYVADLWQKCRQDVFGKDIGRSIAKNRLNEMIKNSKKKIMGK